MGYTAWLRGCSTSSCTLSRVYALRVVVVAEVKQKLLDRRRDSVRDLQRAEPTLGTLGRHTVDAVRQEPQAQDRAGVTTRVVDGLGEDRQHASVVVRRLASASTSPVAPGDNQATVEPGQLLEGVVVLPNAAELVVHDWVADPVVVPDDPLSLAAENDLGHLGRQLRNEPLPVAELLGRQQRQLGLLRHLGRRNPQRHTALGLVAAQGVAERQQPKHGERERLRDAVALGVLVQQQLQRRVEQHSLVAPESLAAAEAMGQGVGVNTQHLVRAAEHNVRLVPVRETEASELPQEVARLHPGPLAQLVQTDPVERTRVVARRHRVEQVARDDLRPEERRPLAKLTLVDLPRHEQLAVKRGKLVAPHSLTVVSVTNGHKRPRRHQRVCVLVGDVAVLPGNGVALGHPHDHQLVLGDAVHPHHAVRGHDHRPLTLGPAVVTGHGLEKRRDRNVVNPVHALKLRRVAQTVGIHYCLHAVTSVTRQNYRHPTWRYVDVKRARNKNSLTYNTIKRKVAQCRLPSIARQPARHITMWCASP